MDLAAIFAAIPGAVPVDGVPDAWFWTHAPKFGHTAVLSRDGKHAFQCYAHNSYDEGLARAVVAFAREHDGELVAPPERPLVVVEGFEHTGFGFDAVVAVSPAVHKYQADKPEVHEVTRAVFPAYRCEFSGAESEEDAAYRYTRAGGAQPSRWDREPNPYLKLRHRAASGREIPERGFVNPSRIVKEFADLPGRADGFVEFENYERRVWLVTWRDEYVVASLDAAGAEPGRLGFDALVEFTKQALYGPNLASGDSAITKP